MRFKRGAQVEVLSMKKSASGSWRCAEIVSAYRDGYTVRYYRGLGVYSDTVEKVSFNVVRPCPPLVKGPAAWSVGDVVEVLDCGYWRTAVIEEVLDGGCYFIHAVGSIDEFRVGKSSIRMRLELRDNKWVPLEKDAKIGKDIMSKTFMRISPQRQCDVKAQNGPVSALTKSLKRPLPSSSPRDEAFAETIVTVSEPSRMSTPHSSTLDEDDTEMVKRRKVGEHELAYIPQDAYSFVGKVDNPIIPMTCPGKGCVEIQSNKSVSNCRNQDYHAARLAKTSESVDCDSVSVVSSVGSCVGTVNIDRILSHSLSGCSQDSDAESAYMGDEEEVATSHLERVDDQSSHEKALFVYRSTLESLFASGPLSWDLEAFLTDLRMRLLVSNDEHLLELRRLKSVGVSCY